MNMERVLQLKSDAGKTMRKMGNCLLDENWVSYYQRKGKGRKIK